MTVPVPVDQRVEFLSAGWIEEAGAFLRAALEAEPALRHERFVLCEAFSDPPPHLGSREGRVAWHATIGDGRVDVGPGALAGADLEVTGDYQAALALAQSMHSAGDAAQARAQREFAHRRNGGLQVTGAAPADPALQTLLRRLHDHMAARTVENPDLAHRVRRLGLEQPVAQLREQGYCIIERAATEAFADELRSRVAEEVLAHHPLTTNGLMQRDRLFEEVALHPLVCTVAESAVGGGMLLGAMSGTYKKTGRGAIDIHSDYALVPEPYPDFAMNCVACWALEDWDEAAGPTWVIPGSHREKRAPRKHDARDGAVPILMPKGSVALWSHGVWHWQGDRASPGARVAIHVTYNRMIYRPLDDFGAVPEATFARNPPAFSTLMGLDDPFGKSSFTGHDGMRFRHAARLVQR